MDKAAVVFSVVLMAVILMAASPHWPTYPGGYFDGSGQAQGDIIVGTSTQGIKLDASTTNGTLTVTDESGGNAIITAYRLQPGSGEFRPSLFNVSWAGGSADVNNTSPTQPVTLASGTQNNVANAASGAVSIVSGDTTTDGNTGDVTIGPGAAGAGEADSGALIMQTHGTERWRVTGTGGYLQGVTMTCSQLAAAGTSGRSKLVTDATVGNNMALCVDDGTNWVLPDGSGNLCCP